MKINIASPQDSNFLKVIETIANKPKKLYFIGNLASERLATVAIVGSRKPTTYGKDVTYDLAYKLASRGVLIVSGLALGVDAIAHRAAIDAGGTTIAVLANGVDQIYPSLNRNLAQDIIKSGGAILSEYEPGTGARAYQFLERNRIVSGLSDAVLITEAAIRSGTMSTAAHALEQGREVFVVPGNITSPMSAGCNNLIKQGAHPVTCVDDILEIIAPDKLNPQTSLLFGSNELETKIISLLKSGIHDGDELQKRSELSASEYSQTMTIMEISGIIRPLGGNQWSLK